MRLNASLLTQKSEKEMEYTLASELALEPDACLVLGLLEEGLDPSVETLNQSLNGLITRLQHKSSLAGHLQMQADIDGASLLIANCGKNDSYTMTSLLNYVKKTIHQLTTQCVKKAIFAFPLVENTTPHHQLEMMLQTIDATLYSQPHFKTKEKTSLLTRITFYMPGTTTTDLDSAEKIARAVTYTRTLADLPANICTPGYMSQTALNLAKELPAIKCTSFDKQAITDMKMGGVLAVSQGSDEPPYFMELVYEGAETSQQPIVLVGKGVTFDSGGISLKPPQNMNEMKYDMSGAATVLGVIKACAELKLPINLIGLIPCVENLPSGKAVKPGDVITMMNQKTVEVLNTDAEGRLILADALTFAERFNPAFVIDIATLTGAIIIALGHATTGYMTTDQRLAKLIETSAESTLDKAWRLPLYADYEEDLESPVADMINAGFDRAAGSIIAGKFLSHYTEAYPWAHLDIAGTAWTPGKKRVSTGRPVRLLVELLRHANTFC